MRASVIVPAHDAAATLTRTLAALSEQQLEGGFEVIVVDDGSADGTGTIAEQAGVRIIRIDRPVGPGASRNRGAEAAGGGVLAFTDADCAPAPGWLAAGVQALADAGLVQGRVAPRPDVAVGPFDKTLWVTRPWGLFESANLFVRRDIFDRLGGFDDGLLPLAGAHFGEDVIFGWRARRAGIRTAFCSAALVHHEVFRRSAADYVSERRRTRLFPVLAREVPELRHAFFYRRFFLDRRSAAVALAAGGVLAAAAVRRPGAAALAGLPYARLLMSDARQHNSRVAIAKAAADAVGLAYAIRGSVAARTLVL